MTTAQLGAGAWIFDLDPEKAAPAVSVLLAGSALFAAVVARSGEHRFVQALFAVPRRALAVVAIAP